MALRFLARVRQRRAAKREQKRIRAGPFPTPIADKIRERGGEFGRAGKTGETFEERLQSFFGTEKR